MEIEMSVGERGQVVIPKAIRDEMGIGPATKVVFGLDNGIVTLKPKKDMRKFDAAIAKFRGTAKTRLREMGFNSTDEFIEAIRGR
ncbi:MAG: AbrB/MazE/SpoVT family DNA-binding domain-containing protein [Acidobacteriaceae bacterium]